MTAAAKPAPRTAARAAAPDPTAAARPKQPHATRPGGPGPAPAAAGPDALRPAAKPAAAPHRRGRGALLAIALLLGGAAVLRLAHGIGEAAAMIGSGSESPSAPAPPATEIDPPALLAALRAREARVEERERALAARMQALALVEGEIGRRLAALEAAEARLSATLALAARAAEDDLARLTAVYEAMKPQDAAALFAEMAPEFAAGFLARMRPDAAAAVMAGLPPRLAYTISVLLAGRNAAVPRE